ncbi:serine/threonine-protein kinase [Neorhizobium sp. T25_13]|uniref:serine/threonine-protein kinase n=1 Tax=Neorhizobium sp. T25_13 TaxID=2093830 RepID=UPI000CF89352|nr:serine/threonine-protein kinase [Neorhizobium sp. T25_13]
MAFVGGRMTFDALVTRLKSEADGMSARLAVAESMEAGRLPPDIAQILLSAIPGAAPTPATAPASPIPDDMFDEDTVPHAFVPSPDWLASNQPGPDGPIPAGPASAPEAPLSALPSIAASPALPGPLPPSSRPAAGQFPPTMAAVPEASRPGVNLPTFDDLRSRVGDAVLSDLIGDYKGRRGGERAEEAGSRRSDALDGLLGSYRSARFRSAAKRAVRDGVTTGASLGKLGDTGAQRAGIGSILRDRFILDREVGRGGMGIVYSAVDRRRLEAGSAQPYVALKLLNDEFRSNSNALRTLEAEARKSQSLAHPNIATVFDFDRDKSEVFIVMELLTGKPLNRHLATSTGQQMPIGLIAPVLKGICAGLAYAHANGVIHSDLKPGNIFVGEDKQAKLIDFGLATANNLEGFNVGALEALTVAYASPEMFIDAPRDPRDDIYALGCIAYQMFMGFHPFAMKPSIDAQLLELKPEPIADLDPSAWKTIEQALRFDRDERIASVEVFAQAIFES